MINALRRFKRYLKYLNDYLTFKSLTTQIRFNFQFSSRYPCLDDNSQTTNFDKHYVYHPAWALRTLKSIGVEEHIDISSTLQFAAMASAIFKVKFLDYRPANILLDNLTIGAADLLKLPFEDNSISSLSCMHVIEHVGLGRYGDQLDYDGDLKAIKELSRVLSFDGHLLIVVPVAKDSAIQFNAHRIYEPKSIIEEFEKCGISLIEFSLIPEDDADGGIIRFPDQKLIEKQKYGCGCFWFHKRRI